MTINDDLSLLQIKYDYETIYGLIKSLQRDRVTSFGIIPYFTLTVATILEMLPSNLADKSGNTIISSSNLDRKKPLFGLVETCFDGMSYKDLKDSVILETKRISNILSQWLETQSLCIKPVTQ